MKITINYYGQSRQFAGIEQETLDVDDDAVLRDVLQAAVSNHADLQRLLFADDGTLRASVLLPVNGEVPEQGGDAPLNDNDEVAIMPALAGG